MRLFRSQSAAAQVLALLAVLFQTADGQTNPSRLDNDGKPLPPGVLYRLGTSAWRDCAGGQGLAYSPDGKKLAYVRMMREVRILDAETGKILRTISPQLPAGEEPRLLQLAWAPDGGEVAIRTIPGRVMAFDTATTEQRWRFQIQVEDFGHPHGARLRYSPDGRRIAAPFPQTSVVFDRKSRQVVLQDKNESWQQSFEFSADSRRLLKATSKPPVKIWDLESGKLAQTWTEPGVETIRSASISPDGRWAAVACPNIVVVDLESKKELARLTVAGDHQELLETAFTPDGKRLISASRHVQGWNTSDWSEVANLTSDVYFNVTETAIRPDGRHVAICDGNRIWVWDLTTGKLQEDTAPAHDGGVQGIDISPDGKLLATGTHDKHTHLWDVKTGRHLRTLPAPGLRVRFSADSARLVTTFARETHLRTWEPSTGRLLSQWSAGDEFINLFAFSADRRQIAVVHDKLQRDHSIERIAWPNLMSVDRFDRSGQAWAGGLSPDGSVAAIQLRDAVELVDLDHQKSLGWLADSKGPGVFVLFTADGRFAISRVTNHNIGVWELATLVRVHLLTGHKAYPTALALAPGERFLASGDSTLNAPAAWGQPRQIRFWDLTTGQQVAALSGHDSDVSSLVFSPDGTMLVSGLHDSTVIAWETPPIVRQRGLEQRALAMSEAEDLWQQLSSPDPTIGQAAVVRLTQDPATTVALAQRKLHPSRQPPGAELQPLFTQLDSDEFAERKAAAEKLAQYGPLIAAPLRAQVQQSASSEVRLRCSELLELANRKYPQSGRRLLETRAVQLLESIGSDAAIALLRELAAGAAEAHLTGEAQRAMKRFVK